MLLFFRETIETILSFTVSKVCKRTRKSFIARSIKVLHSVIHATQHFGLSAALCVFSGFSGDMHVCSYASRSILCVV